jgi:hypothetical protein
MIDSVKLVETPQETEKTTSIFMKINPYYTGPAHQSLADTQWHRTIFLTGAKLRALASESYNVAAANHPTSR